MLFRVTMQTLPPGRRPLSTGSRAGLGAAIVLLVVVSAVEYLDGPKAQFIGILAAVPFLAAVFAFWQTVLVVGVLATIVGMVFVGADRSDDVAGLVNVVGIMLATGIAASVATIRQRQATRIAELQKLAAVAQQAVLRPVGPQVGSLAVAGRYISATAAADIGGGPLGGPGPPVGGWGMIRRSPGAGQGAGRVAGIVAGSCTALSYARGGESPAG